MHHYQGAYTALITPFRDGKVDYDALERLVEHQVAAGIDGLVPCGTTGESPTLSMAEHDETIERVVKFARKRVPVIAGAGSNCTADAVRLSRHAAEAGADGLLHVAPYYNRPTQEGLFRHYSEIARSVDLPIMLYNIPGRCGVEIAHDTVRRLRDAHANITAIKHATGGVADAAALMDLCDIAVLSGDDPITLPLMSLGAVGVVSVISNLAPRTVRKLTQAALAGDLAAARQVHRRLHARSRRLLNLAVNPIPIKAAMALRGFCTDELRLPLCPLDAQQRQTLESLLAEWDMD
jgi:4-hydroxy-tetrahydrodipicolinate synthase